MAAKAPESMDAKKDGYTDKGGSSYTQIAGQKADNEQKADADAKAVQVKPSNTAASIRVLSPGKGGDVTQSNDATAVGIAKNDNETKQFIDQTQGSSAPTMAAPEKDGYRGRSEKDGYKDARKRVELHADRRPEGRQRSEGVRRRDGDPDEAVQRERPDPRRLEGRRRRRHAVEQHDRNRGRAERQRHEAVDRPDPGLVHADHGRP